MAATPQIFPCENPLGSALDAFDWTSSPLGPPDGWPSSLIAAVSLMTASAQPMFIAWGPERTLLYNDAYVTMLGRKHPSAMGRPFHQVWNEAWTDLYPLFARVFASESIYMSDIALMLDRRDGLEAAHFAFSYTPIRETNGQVSGLFCACTETTDSVLAKKRREEDRDRLAQLFEQGPNFMAMLEGPDHRIELANAAYRKLVGDRDVVGKTIEEALPDAVRQGYLDLLNQVFRSGKAFSSSGAKYAVEATPGGPIKERFVDFIFQPLTDAAGWVTGIFIQGSDVTERTLAEAALRESEVQLRDLNATLEQQIDERSAKLLAREVLIRAFFQHSSECHAVLDQIEEGVFRYEEINPATLKVYNKTRDQVIGLTTDEIFGPERAAELNRHLEAAVHAGGPYSYERAQDDGIVEAIAILVPHEAGMRKRLVVTARDVTESRRLEQQLRQSQKMEAVGQLTGGVAHDFNNLLTGIMGSLELLQTRAAQGRLQESERYITVAQGAAKRAATLTHRLLAFSRQQTLDAQITDINRLIVDMGELVRRTAGPEIKVEIVTAVGLWPTMIDRNQLENALLNLCINARDAMPNGGKLIVETGNRWLEERTARERDLRPGQYISLCVSDNGKGMPADIIARAFDPFYTTKPLGEGTGLGLSMVYGFARQSGGQVRIYSEVGQGTMVCIYLPRHHGENVDPEEFAEPAGDNRAQQSEVILVVDDEPTIRMLVVEVLDELGYTALEAGDGPSALTILKSDAHIDLLVTDVGLPGGMNGRQLADAARAIRPDLKVLFITGYAENAAVGHGHLASGMQVMTKPFALDALGAKIREIIEK